MGALLIGIVWRNKVCIDTRSNGTVLPIRAFERRIMRTNEYRADDYPRQSHMEDALLRYIYRRGGSIDVSIDYENLKETLADEFCLTDEQRGRTAPPKICNARDGSVWLNHIQQVRRKLVAKGKLARSSARGVWKLTPEAMRRFHGSVS
jgi:hypothetical protein